MRIPPYWAKGSYTGTDRNGRERRYAVWSWSFDSVAAAQADAAERARRVFETLSNRSATRQRRDDYDYLERPLREEIVDLLAWDEEQIGVITRNRYGALVLNTASVCFVDVDFPPAKASGILDAIRMLFSPQRKRDRALEQQAAVIRRIMAWAEEHPTRSFRLYQTAAGLRLLFTDRLYAPAADETSQLLEALGSDPLYRRLTLRQECFRARLSPKPWRCGCRRPPNRYPRENAQEEQAYRAWEQEYDHKSELYGICRLLDTRGEPAENEHIATVIDLHDEFACLDERLPLA